MKKVTVVIPTTERTLPYLERCVTSLRQSIDWDIIVVSNGTPYTYPINVPGITIRLHTKDQGQCIAVNTGANHVSSDTDYLMVCNDDHYFAPSWFNDVEDILYPLVWSPNLIEPSEVQSAKPFLNFDGGAELAMFKKEAIDEFVRLHEDNEIEGGFNLPFFIRRDVWQTIGGYDIAYDPWGSNSDTDLQTKIELAGIKPKRIRDCIVYHFGSKSGTFEPDKQAFWQKNWDYYTQKFGFNRDQLGSDTWYCKNMIDYDCLVFKPDWLNKYKEDTK